MEKKFAVSKMDSPFLNRLLRHCRAVACITAFTIVMLNVGPAYSLVSHGARVDVSNVRVTISGLRVTVRYDLTGSPHGEYNVALVLRNRNNPSFRYIPRMLSGDVGTGEYAGKNEEIEWDMTREFPQGLQGNGYYFVVDAEEAGGSASSVGLFTWIGGAAVVIAAVVAYLIV